MPKKSVKVARRRTTSNKAKGKAGSKGKKRAKPRKLVVRRTSGRSEKFDKDKMTQTMSRSGTPFLMARDVAKTVSNRISKNKDSLGDEQGAGKSEVEIDGSVIRQMVADEIRSRNRPDIASSLTGESPENTRQGRHRMANDNEPVLDKTAANRTKLLFDKSSRVAKSTKAQAA